MTDTIIPPPVERTWALSRLPLKAVGAAEAAHVAAPLSLYPRTQRTWWARLWRSLRWR